MNSNIAVILMEASAMGNFSLVNEMISELKDVNESNKVNGWTCLHWATSRKHVDIIKRLLIHGANPDLKDISGVSPKDLARKSNNKDVLACFDINEQIDAEKTITEHTFIPNYLKNPELRKLWASAADYKGVISPPVPNQEIPKSNAIGHEEESATLKHEVMIMFGHTENIIGILPFDSETTVGRLFESIVLEMDLLQTTSVERLSFYRIHNEHHIPINRLQFYRIATDLFPTEFNKLLLTL